MAMHKDQKSEIIDEIVEKLRNNLSVYITNASGMTVAEANQLRREMRSAGIDFKVYKNTFVRLAMERLGGYDEVFPYLNGPTAVALSTEPALPAKVIKKFVTGKERQLPEIKGAYIDGAVYGEGSMDTLAKLKGKNELLGDVIGLLLSPATNIVSAITAPGSALAGIAQVLAEREEA